jgi:diguanylate cyclase (GGDEF)-like protein
VTSLLLAVLAVLLSAAGFGAGLLRRRHRDLQALHTFVAESLQADTNATEVTGADVLRRTRVLLSAEATELVYLGGDSRLRRVRVDVDDRVSVSERRITESDWLLLRVRDLGDPVRINHRTPHRALRRWLASTGLRDAMLAPVPLDGGRAVIVVSNRLDGTRWPRHTQSQLQRLTGPFAEALRAGERLHRLRFDAGHDALTGLANRAVLCGRLDAELARPDRSSAVVLMLDLNRFKEVNDTLGHHVGDALLRVVAQRLKNALPSAATIARLGGDEFAVVLSGLPDPLGQAEEYASAVTAALGTPVRLDDVLVTTQASVGIAAASGAATSADLLRQADTAMYVAKSSGAQITIYSPELDRGRTERLALLADLQSALDRDEFILRYQPKLAIGDLPSVEVDAGLARSAERHRITCVEALVRWQHPQLGLLSPDAFIPLADASGLVEPLTRIVLGKALHQLKLWDSQGLTLSVAVNLPARSVMSPALPSLVADLLGRTGVAPSRLTLEITEASIMEDAERIIPILEQLAELGVELSLDDFGTGYSSLSYLQRLPVREVKIDHSFVLGLTDASRKQASGRLIRSIVSLATGLGLRVVAEGVEDEECLRALLTVGRGIELVQGYLIGRPMDAEQLARRIGATPDDGQPVRPPLATAGSYRIEAAPHVPEPRTDRDRRQSPERLPAD